MTRSGYLGRSRWRHYNTQYMLSRLQKETNVTRTKAGKRKLRLFACGCCRFVWKLLPAALRQAVEIAEAFADGTADPAQLAACRRQVEGLNSLPTSFNERAYAISVATDMAIGTTRPNAFDAAFEMLTTGLSLAGCAPASPSADAILADLLCCVFGAYVQKPEDWQAWTNATVLGIARAIDVDRAFDRMAILGDALEDAGCTSVAVLDHCRQPTTHVRGCWVIDQLLGRG